MEENIQCNLCKSKDTYLLTEINSRYSGHYKIYECRYCNNLIKIPFKMKDKKIIGTPTKETGKHKVDFQKIKKSIDKGIKGIKKQGKEIKKGITDVQKQFENFDPMKDFKQEEFKLDLDLHGL